MVFWLVIGGIARGKRLYGGRRKDGKIERVVIVINLLESYRRKCDDNNIYIYNVDTITREKDERKREKFMRRSNLIFLHFSSSIL